MSDIPFDRLVEPKPYEDWHEWDCDTSSGPPGPFSCNCKLSKGWKVFLLPPETRDCRCSHRRDQHLNDEECTGDNDFCVCVKYVPSSGSSTAQTPLRLAGSGEWLIQAGRLAEERLRKIPREMLDPTARRLLDSIDANRSNEQKDDWKYCFHSSGNEPGCAACWHGSYLRANIENIRLRAALTSLDRILGPGGNLNESGCRALREGIAKALNPDRTFDENSHT